MQRRPRVESSAVAREDSIEVKSQLPLQTEAQDKDQELNNSKQRSTIRTDASSRVDECSVNWRKLQDTNRGRERYIEGMVGTSVERAVEKFVKLWRR